MPSSPSSLPLESGPTVRTGVGASRPFASTTRTRPLCSATNMRVSCARHASATGLLRPDTTGASATRTRARSGGEAGRVEGDTLGFVPVLVPVVGAGLVGGIGVLDVILRDDPLLHAARPSSPAAPHE